MSLEVLVFLFPALAVAAASVLFVKRESWDAAETPDQYRAFQRAYERALRTIKDVEFEYQVGTLSAEEHARLKAEYKQRAIAARRSLERARLAAVRRIARGENTGLSSKEEERLEALVAARARTLEKESKKT